MYLTRRQRQILDFIKEFIAAKGYSPSLEEIGKDVGLSSLATVHVHLRNLDKKGLIRHRKNRSRAIELREDPTRNLASRAEIIEIPILGEVAAGAPIEALQRDDEAVELPSSLVGRKETFVLRVKGDSMIEDSIADGDLIICERRETAENGETVVALLRGEEVTVKRFYREKGRIRLQPANATMKPIIVAPSQVRVQGVVIGLLRKF